MLNFKAFQKLSSQQWRWLWEAYWRLWLVLLSIKLRKGTWLNSKLNFVGEFGTRQTRDSISGKNQALDMHEAVRLAARLHILRANCLPRSIVLADMLCTRSYDARTIIGVVKRENGLASHAWVELDGAMLGEPENVSTDFTPLQH